MKTTYVIDPAKTARQLRAALIQHTEAVTGFLARLDVLMKRPSTEQRGKDIAALSNALEMANDSVRYSVLGINFRTDKKPARRAALSTTRDVPT